MLCIDYFSSLFVSGKLFKSSDLNLVVEFFLMFHKEKPIDWLLDHILYVKVCNPEKDTVSTVKVRQLDRNAPFYCDQVHILIWH